MDRTLKGLKAIWAIAVRAAVLVALPQLAVGLLVIAPHAAGAVTTEPLGALLTALWPFAGSAGLLALLMSRQRGLRLSRVRIYQAMLASGIAAALAALVMIAHAPSVVAAVGAVSLAVLIVDAAARIHVLEERAAVLAAPADRIAAALFGLAALSGVSALVGHLLI